MKKAAPANPTPVSRCWLQFSLRTLLLVMVLAACLSAWLGAEYRRGQRQYAAIAWVESMGGSIDYRAEEGQEGWRRRWFGNWYPEPVRGVLIMHLSHGTDLGPLAELEDIEELWLMNGQDIDLETLSELKDLEVLQLRDTRVHNLKPLAALTNLRKLIIIRSGINQDDQEVRDLQESLPHCRIAAHQPRRNKTEVWFGPEY